MKRADIQIRQNGERGIVDLLTKLIETGVTGADADPKDSRGSFDGKNAGAFEGKREGLHADPFQSRDQPITRLDLHVPKKTQRQMKLVIRRPANMAQGRS